MARRVPAVTREERSAFVRIKRDRDELARSLAYALVEVNRLRRVIEIRDPMTAQLRRELLGGPACNR